MKFFTQLITSFCASTVFIGAIFMLCPEGKMSKSVRYLLSLVFILTVITACCVTVKTPNFSLESFEVYEEDSSQSLIAAAKYVYSFALTKEGINFKEITVCTNKDADGGIVINKVIINSNCEKEKILKALSEVSENYEVEIINE